MSTFRKAVLISAGSLIVAWLVLFGTAWYAGKLG